MEEEEEKARKLAGGIKALKVKQRDYFECPKPVCGEDLGFWGSFVATLIGVILAGGIVS